MKRLVVLGAGESGVGTAILALQKGYEVFVSDYGNIQDKYKQQLNEVGVEWEEQTHTLSRIVNATEVVKSPGIPDKAPIIKALLEKGVPVISEIEFACRYTKAKLIGITGSNGKTTTTMLIYQMLCDAGLHVGLGGNIGQSFALQVARFDYDIYVLELSSFQLDGMFEAKLDVAILTNITPDHLDRYNYDFELYVAAKLRVIQNQDRNSFFITCLDDMVVQQQIESKDLANKVNVLQFSAQAMHGDAFVQDKELRVQFGKRLLRLPVSSLQIQGRHNHYNTMAAALTGFVMNLTADQVSGSLQKFKAVEHRLEVVALVNGVQFINDSKATNVDSTYYALECMPKDTILIMGGTDKGNVYDDLLEFVHDKVKAIVCLGVDNSKLQAAFGKQTQLLETKSMVEAVQLAYEIAHGKGTILLSPACASFDLFKNYEDRGRQFKAAVQDLITG